MTRLTHVQDDFQNFLLLGDAAVEAHVVGTERVPAATRLGIYGNAYRARLIEALQTNFPVLTKLMGETDFDTMAARYVRAHDSIFFSIRYYGDRLADFLASDPGYASAPVLAELARWEWTLTEVFDAADAAPVKASALTDVKPEQWGALHFELHPSVRTLELAWNVPQIWKAIMADAERPQADLHGQPMKWLLWRQELETYFRSLTAAEGEAVEAARAGQSFGEICILLCAHYSDEEAPVRAAGFLRNWVESGLISAVSAA